MKMISSNFKTLFLLLITIGYGNQIVLASKSPLNLLNVPNEINAGQIITITGLIPDGFIEVISTGAGNALLWDSDISAWTNIALIPPNGEVDMKGSVDNFGIFNVREFDSSFNLLGTVQSENKLPIVTVISIDGDTQEGTINYSLFNIERVGGALSEAFEFNLNMVGIGANPASNSDISWEYKDTNGNWQSIMGNPILVTLNANITILEVRGIAINDGIQEADEEGNALISPTVNTNSNLVINNNSTYTLIYDLVVLPIKLLAFEVNLSENKFPIVSWTTSNEFNNSYFEIQRSFDGINFEDVANIIGAGTNDGYTEYSWIDYESLKNGIYYYRLKQVDFDGKSEVFEIKSIVLKNRDKPEEIIFFPNPVQFGESIYLSIEKGNNILITLTGIDGKIVLNQKSLKSGINILSTNNLQKGVYFIQVFNKNLTHCKVNAKLLIVE